MVDIKINNGQANPIGQTVYYIEGKYPHQKPRTVIILGAEPGWNGDVLGRIRPCFSNDCGLPNAPEIKYTSTKALYNTLQECQDAINTELDTIRKNYINELSAGETKYDRINNVVKFCIDRDTRKDGTDPIARQIAHKYLKALGIEV